MQKEVAFIGIDPGILTCGFYGFRLCQGKVIDAVSASYKPGKQASSAKIPWKTRVRYLWEWVETDVLTLLPNFDDMRYDINLAIEDFIWLKRGKSMFMMCKFVGYLAGAIEVRFDCPIAAGTLSATIYTPGQHKNSSAWKSMEIRRIARDCLKLANTSNKHIEDAFSLAMHECHQYLTGRRSKNVFHAGG